MALRHYGGSTPKVEAEWTCPSCQFEQAGPLKAGCQKCGAGADARKVGDGSGAGHPEAVTVHKPAAVGPSEVPVPTAVLAFEAWLRERTTPSTEADWELVRGAFMAGVAWAHGQAVTPPVTVVRETPVGEQETGVRLLFAFNTAEELGAREDVDPPTLQTLLAALAFYRDNVLNYGAVPGQLDAVGVNALIARLSPVEEP